MCQGSFCRVCSLDAQPSCVFLFRPCLCIYFCMCCRLNLVQYWQLPFVTRTYHPDLLNGLSLYAQSVFLWPGTLSCNCCDTATQRHSDTTHRNITHSDITHRDIRSLQHIVITTYCHNDIMPLQHIVIMTKGQWDILSACHFASATFCNQKIMPLQEEEEKCIYIFASTNIVLPKHFAIKDIVPQDFLPPLFFFSFTS